MSTVESVALVACILGLAAVITPSLRRRLARGRMFKSFRWCGYVGGTDAGFQVYTRVVTVTVYQDSICIGGLFWRGRERVVPRDEIKSVRRLDTLDTMGQSGIDVVADFQKRVAKADPDALVWRAVLLRWHSGNALVLFRTSDAAAEFLRLLE